MTAFYTNMSGYVTEITKHQDHSKLTAVLNFTVRIEIEVWNLRMFKSLRSTR